MSFWDCLRKLRLQRGLECWAWCLIDGVFRGFNIIRELWRGDLDLLLLEMSYLNGAIPFWRSDFAVVSIVVY